MAPVAPQMFRTMDAVEAYLGGATIRCLLCGREMQQLGNHLRAKHAWDKDQYKRHFGIPKTRKLVSGALHEKLSAAADKMMAKRGSEWDQNFKQRGIAISHSTVRNRSYVPVLATVDKLRGNAAKASRAFHAKYSGSAMSLCPDCGRLHPTSAQAALKKDGVRCPGCRTLWQRKKERASASTKARTKKQYKKRQARIGGGEIVSQLAQDIYDFVAGREGPARTKEIIEAVSGKHPGIKRQNYKKRISDLLAAGRLERVEPGLYRALTKK